MTWKEFREQVEKNIKDEDVTINFIDINEDFDIEDLKVKTFKRPTGENNLNIY